MDINHSDRFAWFSRGKILANLGKLEESLDCFERAIAIKRDYYEAWCEKGTVLEQLGDTEAAERCFDESLGAFCSDLSVTLEDDLEILATPADESPNSSYNQACFHAIQGNVDLALTYLEEAIAYNPLKYSMMALRDVDFTSIDKNPQFQQLTCLFPNAAC